MISSSLQSKGLGDLITNTYSFGDFNAFSGNFLQEIVTRLEKCELVAEVSRDAKFKGTVIKAQQDAPRHLARVSRGAPMSIRKRYSYLYDSSFQGQNINVYVIDSGIKFDLPQFGGRAYNGKDFTGEGQVHLNGHGSHVAGIIGSETYGVFKRCKLINVKVLDRNNDGESSRVLAAIEFCAKHRQKKSGKSGVANLSLGDDTNALVNKAVKIAKNMGLVIVAAAGNDNVDSCTKSPAGSPNVITVGAINHVNDGIAPFSNWGKCVDLFAVGTEVVSVDVRSPKYRTVFEGTSMAAPVVTGLVANLLSEEVPFDKIKQVLLARSTKNRIPMNSMFFKYGSPNRVAHNGIVTPQKEHKKRKAVSMLWAFLLELKPYSSL